MCNNSHFIPIYWQDEETAIIQNSSSSIIFLLSCPTTRFECQKIDFWIFGSFTDPSYEVGGLFQLGFKMKSFQSPPKIFKLFLAVDFDTGEYGNSHTATFFTFTLFLDIGQHQIVT